MLQQSFFLETGFTPHAAQSISLHVLYEAPCTPESERRLQQYKPCTKCYKKTPQEGCQPPAPASWKGCVSKQPWWDGKLYSGQQRRKCPLGWPSTNNSQQLSQGCRREHEGLGSTGRGHGPVPWRAAKVMGGGADADIWGSQGSRPLGVLRERAWGDAQASTASPSNFFCSMHSSINLNTQQKTQKNLFNLALTVGFFCWFGFFFQQDDFTTRKLKLQSEKCKKSSEARWSIWVQFNYPDIYNLYSFYWMD